MELTLLRTVTQTSASELWRVAQVSNLLYRRFPIGNVSPALSPLNIRARCRLEACATSLFTVLINGSLNKGALFLLLLSLSGPVACAAELSGSGSGSEHERTMWGNVVEADFPFFSSVLDARRAGNGLPTNNLTPRGIILNLGHECWACFDTDLLRMSAIWTGKGVTPVSMAQGSYHVTGVKAQK